MQPELARAQRPVALTPVELHTVRAIVDGVIPGSQIRAFGSRATGTARPFSDLDLLVVEPVQLTWRQRAALRECFEASALPFRVDVVEATGLAEGMAERVWLESVPLG